MESLRIGISCPHCRRTDGQMRAGTGNDGVAQRYKCRFCQRRYTGRPANRGYPSELHEQAAFLRAEGVSLREISRRLQVNHQTVANWLRAAGPIATPPSVTVTESESGRPTIGDVAARAGVPTSTVSAYLNDCGPVEDDARRRVIRAMEALHFTPSGLVRRIRRRRTHTFGVLLSGMTDLEGVESSLTAALLAGMNQAAAAAEHKLLLYPGWLDRRRSQHGLPFLDGHIDGLLWVAPKGNESVLARLSFAGLPTVALLTRHVPAGVGYVTVDNVAAMHEIVTHLRVAGHERIAYIGPASDADFRDRIDGYRRALTAVGLQCDPSLEVVLSMDRNFWAEAAYQRALDCWQALPEPPTAIVVPDDEMASRVIDLLRERGLRVPDDIAVTGFNDIADARYIGGGLTTFRQPLRRIGERATEQLIALIGGAPVEECRITLPGTLIPRATTERPVAPSVCL